MIEDYTPTDLHKRVQLYESALEETVSWECDTCQLFDVLVDDSEDFPCLECYGGTLYRVSDKAKAELRGKVNQIRETINKEESK